MIELPIRVAAPDVSHVDALASGVRLGEFEIRGLIGVGGFGMVYRAYDHSLQRDVAIKEYMPTGLACRGGGGLNISVRASGDAETFETGLRSFVAEARMLAKFEHPSLVRVFRFWEANDTAYMVMPLYHGMTLKQARQSMRKPPSEAWLRKVLWSILGALKVLHRGKAWHRDVSPDNIFLQDSGPPVLLDLGAARLAISDSAKQHTAILKINYAPIEQYADSQGMPQGPWTDLYALAAVVHGLLCNEAPTPAMIRVVNDKLPAFANVVKTVSTEFGQSYSDQFTQAIAWALHIQPQDRPQSVREFARALGIVTPNGMSTFDWRAELGPGSLPGGDVLQLASVPVTQDQTRPNDTDPHFAPTQFIDPTADDDDDLADDPDATLVAQPPTAAAERRNRPREHAVSRPAPMESDSVARRSKPHSSRSPSKHPSSHAATAPRQSSNTIWIVATVVALAMLLAAGWGVRSWLGRAKAAPVVIDASLPAASAAGTASAATPASGAEVVLTPSSKNEPIEEIIESSTPAQRASAAADLAAKAKEKARIAAAKAAKMEAPRAASAPEPVSTPAPVVAAPPPPEPKPAAPAVTPERLCADTNFVTRPMCMFKACQRSDLAGTATCVELQKNLQRNNNDTNKF